MKNFMWGGKLNYQNLSSINQSSFVNLSGCLRILVNHIDFQTSSNTAEEKGAIREEGIIKKATERKKKSKIVVEWKTIKRTRIKGVWGSERKIVYDIRKRFAFVQRSNMSLCVYSTNLFITRSFSFLRLYVQSHLWTYKNHYFSLYFHISNSSTKNQLFEWIFSFKCAQAAGLIVGLEHLMVKSKYSWVTTSHTAFSASPDFMLHCHAVFLLLLPRQLLLPPAPISPSYSPSLSWPLLDFSNPDFFCHNKHIYIYVYIFLWSTATDVRERKMVEC